MRIELCAVLFLALGACHDDDASSDPPAQKKMPEPPRAAAPVAGSSPTAGSPVLAELDHEASNRPTGTPTVEQIMAAIESAGIKLEPKKQVLATVVKAHYCVLTKSTTGLSMSICEFDEDAQARVGLKQSETQFKAIPNRVLEVNGKTLLTMNLTAGTPAVAADRDRVSKVFRQLSAK
jgi:hypothetical protein